MINALPSKLSRRRVLNRTDVLAISIGMARNGLGLNPIEAVDCIAELIAGESPESELFDRRVQRLLALAACIWSLRRDLLDSS